MHFKDHFSGHASAYGKYRPVYPGDLYRYLAELAPGRVRAWDCAAGTGQAAVGLANYFDEVIATDASAPQIVNAQPHERVIYAVATAEKTRIGTKSVDLVVVAQALHWFDLDRFYAEAKRVLKEQGIIAVWSYNLIRVAPEIDSLIDRLYGEILGPHWPPERSMVEKGYGGLQFPFDELSPSDFQMRADWSLDHLLGYLRTWSAAQKYQEATGENPMSLVAEAVRAAWGDPQLEREMRWPLSLRVGVMGAGRR